MSKNKDVELLYIRVPNELKESLKVIADDKGENMSTVTRDAIRYYIKAHEERRDKS